MKLDRVIVCSFAAGGRCRISGPASRPTTSWRDAGASSTATFSPRNALWSSFPCLRATNCVAPLFITTVRCVFLSRPHPHTGSGFPVTPPSSAGCPMRIFGICISGLSSLIAVFLGQHNDARMNLAITITAARLGANTVNHVKCIDLIKEQENGKEVVRGARLKDVLTGMVSSFPYSSIIEWSFDWLIGWLIDWFFDWLPDLSIVRLIAWLIGLWSFELLSDWLIGWYWFDWMVDWIDSIIWLIDWLIDWLTDLIVPSLRFLLCTAYAYSDALRVFPQNRGRVECQV